MASEVVSSVNELPSVSNKQPYLEKILSSLAKMTKSELQAVADQVNVRHLADCVASEAELALSILKRLCEAVEPKFILEKFESLFIMALTSERESILRMALQQLQRVSEECPHVFTSHMNIFVMLFELLFADESGCMALIEGILNIIGKHNVALFTCQETARLLDMVSMEKQLRFFDLVIRMAVESENCLGHFLSNGIFERLFKIYQHAAANDPLLLLNCVELFATIFTRESALSHFQKSGCIVHMFRDMCKSTKDESFASILVPAFIKLFTSVGRVNFALLLVEYTKYFELLDACCRNPKEIGPCLVGLESFAILSQLPEAKEFFASDRMPNIKADEWVKQLRAFVMLGGSDEIQAKTVLICADLFTAPKHCSPSKLYYDTNARWFNMIFDSRLEKLMEWAKSPLAERHVAAQRVLMAIGVQPWGQQIMAGTPGFVDFLVDRNTETDKMGRELKFELVQGVFMSPTSSNFFDGPDVVKLGVYVRQGAFYATSAAAVGLEAES